MIKLIKIIFSIIKIISNIKFEKNKTIIGKKIKFLFELCGPVTIKLGQILSTRSDIIPREIIKELEKLQTNVKNYNFKEIKKILENDLSNDLNKIFKKINENPLASASIAQIHTAILKNNKKVIIKIVKPNINKIIKNNIKILKIIAIIAHIFIKNIRRLKPIDIIKELENTLLKEIDLKNEAFNLLKFRDNFKGSKKIYIPELNINILTNNILILEYIDGINITNIKKIKKIKINTHLIINDLLNFFYIQAFKYKFFHADLHPGNILILKKNKHIVIILIDFGIISILNNNEKMYLSENILAFAQKDYKKIAKLHLKAKTIKNFKRISIIEKELYLIFDKILNKNLKKISLKDTLLNLITLSKKMEMKIQPKFILFQKTLLSIESISRKISPSSNLWEITRHSIEKIIMSEIIKNKIKNILFNKKNNLIKNNKNNKNNKKIFLEKILINFVLVNIFIIFIENKNIIYLII